MDEGAQAREPEAVAPLTFADARTRIIIAGDHKQVKWLDEFIHRQCFPHTLDAGCLCYTVDSLHLEVYICSITLI